MSRWSLVAAVYAAGFLPYIFTPPPLDRIYFSAYVVVVIVSLLLPLGRREVAPKVSIGFFRGMVAFLLVVALMSSFMIPVSIPLNLDASKYVATLWIFFSLIPVIGSTLRLSRLGELLKEAGIRSQLKGDGLQSGLDHFALNYSLQGWLRNTRFFLYFLAILAMYLYGWSLLGLPLLLYSVSMIVLISVVLRTLAKRLLSPYEPYEILHQMESFHPAKGFKAILVRPSPKATLLIAAILSLTTFTGLVENPFSDSNFPIFFLLILSYATALFIYIWAGSSVQTLPSNPESPQERLSDSHNANILGGHVRL